MNNFGWQWKKEGRHTDRWLAYEPPHLTPPGYDDTTGDIACVAEEGRYLRLCVGPWDLVDDGGPGTRETTLPNPGGRRLTKEEGAQLRAQAEVWFEAQLPYFHTAQGRAEAEKAHETWHRALMHGDTLPLLPPLPSRENNR